MVKKINNVFLNWFFKTVVRANLLGVFIIFLFTLLVVIVFGAALVKGFEVCFNDCSVCVTGFVRTTGGIDFFQKGFIPLVYVSCDVNTHQFLFVKIYNDSKLVYKNLLRDGGTVFMRNSTGVFFWASHIGYSNCLITPFVFIICKVDNVWVNII